MKRIDDGLTAKQRYRQRHLKRVRQEDAARKRAVRATSAGAALTKAALAKFRAANRARLAAASREFRLTAAGVATEARRVRNPQAPSSFGLYRRYKLTREAHAEMVAEQNGACKICATRMKRVNVDHCHSTGRVRGLLCQRCNIRLGVIESADFNVWVKTARLYIKGAL